MRILVDENIPNVTIEYLRSVGHDVLLLRGTSAQVMTDEALWAQAQRERRLVVSTDKGICSASQRKALRSFDRAPQTTQ